MRIEREREVKLEVDDDVSLGGLDGALPGATVVELGQRQLRAAYYDTVDLRLARWGCTVRHRNDAGWVVKVPVPGTGKALVRDEVHVEPDGAEPPAQASRLVSVLSRGEPLQRVATIITDRRTTQFRGSGNNVLVELVDDRVDVEEADGSTRRFREVELELADDVPAKGVNRLLERLIAAGCRDAEGVPKLVRGLGPRAAGPSDVVVPEVSAWPTGREVVHAALAQGVVHLLLHVPAIWLGEDPEGVHQARVATRRLRSYLRTFRSLVEPTWAGQLEPELRWLGGELGRVRDDDVLIDTLQGIGAPQPLIDVLDIERRTHRETLLATLDDRRTTALLDLLVAAAHDPPTAPQADDPAADLLQPLVRKRWRRLRKAVADLGPEPADAALHRVRILAKRCRYTVEAASPVLGPTGPAWAKAMAGVQDVLGELNDATVIRARLADTARRSPAIGFAAGETAGQLTARAEAARTRWRKAWKKASDKDLHPWL